MIIDLKILENLYFRVWKWRKMPLGQNERTWILVLAHAINSSCQQWCTLLERVGQSSYIGQNGPFFVPESCSHDQRGNKNTIKSVKHTKTCYFEVSTTFLSYFYLFWSFPPSSEHFQAKMGPNLDLVWYEILEFAWSLRHLNIIIII